MIPVSFGELIDKITILEIKATKIKDPVKHAHVLTELEVDLAALHWFGPPDERTAATRRALKAVNLQLWDVEDQLRVMESQHEFDGGFVSLARSVYLLNDQRAALKRQLNEYAGSEIIEEKSFDLKRRA